MATFVQGAPSPDSSFQSGLRIHHEPGAARDQLILFIHGLNGSAYGTWGPLPEHLYRDSDVGADIGLFDYVSGKRRRLGFSPPLEEVVRELLSQLDGLQYRHIVFVCHSMGGIIASTLLRRSHELSSAQGRHAVVDRSAGLIALASPRAGARLVLFGGQKDARYLKSHNDVVRANDEFFTNQVETHEQGGRPLRFRIPVWVATATGDRLVDRFTASFGVPSSQVDTFPGTHTSFLKNADLPAWISERCQLALSPARRTPRTGPTPAMRTRFRGHPLHGYWQDTFLRAVGRFHESRKDVIVYDATHDPVEAWTDLQVRVLPSEDLWLSETRSEIERYNQDMDDGALYALGLAPYGAEASSAAQQITKWVAHQTAWVCPVDRPEPLEDEIVRWLERTSRSLALAGRIAPLSGPRASRQTL